MASTSLTKTVQKVGSDAITKMTFSAWIKRSKLGEGQIFNAYQLSSYYTRIYFNGSDALAIYSYINSSQQVFIKTNRLFRDTNAWYHLVVSVDTTQATASDRVKIYINGVQETSFASGAEVYPSQNSGFGQFNDTGATLYIGSSPSATNFDGSMSHINYTPYTAYDASAFGSTDATTGEWKINTSPSVTYSTAGFFILKDGNSVTDQSGNSNNFTVGGGTLTKTEDNPSNVFATMNPLVTYGTNQNALSEGNNTTTGIAYHRPSPPTLAVNKGKWYFEAKALSGTASKWWIGLCDTEYDTNNQGTVGSTANYIWGYDATTNAVNQRSQAIYDVNLRDGGGNISISNIFSAPSADDIYAMAVDLDNQKVWYAKNGVWNNGSASQSTTFNASYPDSTNIDADRFYYIGVGSENSKWSVNYGNGYFGTTAVSSAGTNASGIGIFEYDVPTGFTALSTKGLNL
jgi:hypothetical protein